MRGKQTQRKIAPIGQHGSKSAGGVRRCLYASLAAGCAPAASKWRPSNCPDLSRKLESRPIPDANRSVIYEFAMDNRLSDQPEAACLVDVKYDVFTPAALGHFRRVRVS